MVLLSKNRHGLFIDNMVAYTENQALLYNRSFLPRHVQPRR